MVFFSSHVWMWELDHKEGWAPKNWCLQIMVLGKTLESPLDWKKVKPVNPKGNQLWIFIVRTDAEAGAPMLGYLIRRAYSLEKSLMLEKIEGKRRRGDRGWDGWKASLSQWTWACTNSVSVSTKSRTWHDNWTTILLELSEWVWRSLACSDSVNSTATLDRLQKKTGGGGTLDRLQEKTGGGGTGHSLPLPLLLLISLPGLL